MTEQRKTAAPPIVESVPAELMDKTQWVCWRFEWRKEKWTKVPFTPHTAKKARSNAASSWRSFQAALSCYQDRPDFFDGIGFMFSKDDPYVGGDIDHCVTDGTISAAALALLPDTYAEISPSGCGIKFIGRAAGDYGRKTVKGELYSKGRFFTITGNVLPGHDAITECQEAIDAFAAALGEGRIVKEGSAGQGSRAERAASVPDEEWEAGRTLLRTNINRLLARLRASAVSRKTRTDDTQLGMMLREDYSTFHERWPGAGIVRGDGSLDESQIRAVFANGIRIRGFVFSEYAAIMSHFFAEQAIAKWGTKQAWREELASLWLRGRTPRADDPTEPPEAPPVPRGRAGSRAELLDRAYAVLQSYRAGASAILTTDDLASGLGIHRRTAAELLRKLTESKRITKQQHGQRGGLIIRFPGMIYSPIKISGVIYSENENGYVPHTNNSNGYNPQTAISADDKIIDHTSGVIYSEKSTGDAPLPDARNDDSTDDPISADEENEPAAPGMIYSDDNEPLFSAPEQGIPAASQDDDKRGSEAPYIYIESTSIQTVLLPGITITPEKRIRDRVSLADAVSSAFDELPHDRTLPTGELKRWPVTAQRVTEHVQEHYADQGWKSEAIRYWVGKIRKRRRAQPFDELRGMRREELEARAASARKRIATAERKAVTAPMPELREWYAKEAARLSGYQALLAWEQGERDARDAARIEKDGYSAGEQNEMLEIVEREYKPVARPARASSVSPPSADVGGLVARLKARKVND